MSSAPILTNPRGSIRAWLTDTEEGSQRREKDDQHATGHSSKSKPIKSTCVDELVGKNHLSVLGGLSTIGKAEWMEIEITVDSGACETVMPMNVCHSISVLASRQYIEGVEYEVANGETIPNLGERRCLMMTSGSRICKKISFQIANVHKALLSISRIADQGFDCVLGKEGGYLADRESGEIPLCR